MVKLFLMKSSMPLPGSDKTFSVLLLLSWHHDELITGTLKFSKEHNWYTNILPTFSQELPRNWRGDGILMMLPADMGERASYLRLVKQLKKPCVVLSPYPNCAHFPHVHLDHVAIGRLAADHLIERGYNNIYFFSAMRRWDRKLRQQAFVQRLGEHGKKASIYIGPHTNEQRVQEEIRLFVRKIAKAPRPYAIWAVNDIIAASMLEALADANIAVPEEAIVLGCENMVLVAENCRPTLSSIDSNLDGLAYQGATMLHGLMQKTKKQRLSVTVAPRGLVSRASTDNWWAEHEGVRKVINLIRTEYSQNLRSAEFCRAAGMSRIGLFAAINREMGKSAHEILEWHRVKAAEAQLRNTDDKISFVAASCGFRSSINLRRTFYRIHKLSTEAWRKREQEQNPLK